MLTDKQLAELENNTLLLGKKWTLRYLNNESHPPKEQIEHEMISLALINQELATEVKRLREKLVESEEARQCAILTLTNLEERCRTLEVETLLAQANSDYQRF